MKHLQEFPNFPLMRILAIVVAFLLIDQTSSLSTEVKLSRTESNIIRNGKSAVIVGGGPTGLAASLMLEKCGWSDITIIEKRSTAFFESSKAYLYLIDGRGQKCSNLLGILMLVCQIVPMKSTLILSLPTTQSLSNFDRTHHQNFREGSQQLVVSRA